MSSDPLLETNGERTSSSSRLEGDDTTLGPVWRSYLFGQTGHLLRVSLWWSGLSPLAFALVGRESSVGALRVAFNVALFLFSPLGGVLVRRVPMEKVLVLTTGIRGFLYGVALPLVWLFFRSGLLVGASMPAAFVSLVIILFLDGVLVALGNVVDIDMGGVGILGAQLGLPVTDGLRNRMNSLFQIVMDGSFVVFSPACAILGWYLGETTMDEDATLTNINQAKAGILVGIFAVVFVLTSIISIYFYKFSAIPMNDIRDSTSSSAYEPLATADGAAAPSTSGEEQGALEVPAVSSIWGDIFKGAKICWTTRPIRWRLLFLGLEVGMEDAMVAVVVAEYAYTSRYFGDGDATITNLYTALILAVGKLGAIVAASFMHSFWSVPTKKSGYRPLFVSVLFSSASVCLLLFAHSLEVNVPVDHVYDTPWLSRFLVLLSVVLFFMFSTAPKIGFETLLQSMASVVGDEYVFGFVPPFISVVDSVVVVGMSLCFSFMKGSCDAEDKKCVQGQFSNALVITCLIYLLHGLVEALVGPYLMMPSDPAMLEKLEIVDDDNEDGSGDEHEPLNLS
eukprot:CAMPEP_0184524876 /NCGR_PEP_ID=MMETSP0198_2-20121128/9776_1 /TAXON_ID=1112570 /ORGANISM="Thraustochytrium sp., Strain LLF1b" /LENGTH=564 /DNA_ID=CAMNT_0026916253 /DNA_START=1173 /DNA_END=2867 /DNA_ORIENTATION=-